MCVLLNKSSNLFLHICSSYVCSKVADKFAHIWQISVQDLWRNKILQTLQVADNKMEFTDALCEGNSFALLKINIVRYHCGGWS
jgi:hypothetical protein